MTYTHGEAKAGLQLFVWKIIQRLTTKRELCVTCSPWKHCYSSVAGEATRVPLRTEPQGTRRAGRARAPAVPVPGSECRSRVRCPSPGACTWCGLRPGGHSEALLPPFHQELWKPLSALPEASVAELNGRPHLPAGSPLPPLGPVQMHRRSPVTPRQHREHVSSDERRLRDMWRTTGRCVRH